jgi:acetyl-CoA carboxylase biotin carboxyl carrier protein
MPNATRPKKLSTTASAGPRAGGASAPLPDGSRIDRLRELVALIEHSSLAELAYEDEEIAVTLRRPLAPAPPPAAGAPGVHTPPPAAPAAAIPRPPEALGSSSASVRPAVREEPDTFLIRSPFVGTFYRAASPSSPVFTDVNQHVRRGQTVCIIEAMKLMNEIESEVEGTVAEVLAENGQSVQYGEPLFRIRVASKGG